MKPGGLRARKRLARAELTMLLAVKTEGWAIDIEGHPGVIPFDSWPADDPFRSLCRRYDLTPAELCTLLRGVGSTLENRAMANGYDEVVD